MTKPAKTATATPTKSSATSGVRKSTAAKSSAQGAESSSPPKARPVRGAAKSHADSTSDTTTETQQSPEAPSTPVATEQPPDTASNASDSSDESSPTGGPPDLGESARIVSVAKVGPFTEVAFVVMPIEAAKQFIETDKAPASIAVTNVLADIDQIRQSDPALADSGLAATAFAMALELENPYNSATSKSMCARALMDALNRLRELCPPEEKRDDLDDLASRRADRLSGRSDAEVVVCT